MPGGRGWKLPMADRSFQSFGTAPLIRCRALPRPLSIRDPSEWTSVFTRHGRPVLLLLLKQAKQFPPSPSTWNALLQGPTAFVSDRPSPPLSGMAAWGQTPPAGPALASLWLSLCSILFPQPLSLSDICLSIYLSIYLSIIIYLSMSSDNNLSSVFPLESKFHKVGNQPQSLSPSPHTPPMNSA